jgi:hypothetical protein
VLRDAWDAGFKKVRGFITATVDAVGRGRDAVGRIFDRIRRFLSDLVDAWRQRFAACGRSSATTRVAERVRVWGFLFPLLFRRILADVVAFVRESSPTSSSGSAGCHSGSSTRSATSRRRSSTR